MINAKLMKFFVCVFTMLFVGSSAFAEGQLDSIHLYAKDKYPLTTSMLVLEDKTNTLTIDQVASDNYKDYFVENEQAVINLGISKSTFWFKVSLTYPDAYPNKAEIGSWYLEVGSTQFDVAELYLEEFDGIFSVESSDVRTGYHERPIVHVNSVFPIKLFLGQEATFYLKVKKVTSITVPLTLWTPEGFVKKVALEEFVYGMFFGCMLILLGYNLFLYFSVRDISYLYYAFYIAGITLFQVLEMGHGLVHLEKYFYVLKREAIVIIIWWTSIAGVLFAISFMDIKNKYPRIYFIYMIFIAMSVSSFIVTFLVDYGVTARWSAFFNSAFMPTYLGIVFYIVLKGNVNARYFFIAWVSNIIGLLVFAGLTRKMIPANAITLALTPIGILLETIIFSFALANRIKTEQADAILADENAMSNMVGYQSIFDHSLKGMYTMQLSGEMVTANSTMAKMFGFESAEELMAYDMTFARCIFEEPDLQFEELINNRVVSNNLCFMRKDGKKIWAIHRAKMIVDASSGFPHIEGSIENITQIKLRELALVDKEKEIAEKHIAEASTNAKSEFLANMNHEIRTPLAAIIGFSESLKEPGISKNDKSHAVKHVVESSHSLLQLINDILDFSKIEANKLDVEEVFVNVLNTVNAVRGDFEPKALEKNVKFDVVFRYPIPSVVLGDPTRISQVLTNLCANAIKFTEAGSVMLIVSWDEEINRLKFEVVDSGLGMEDSVTSKLFQVFDQADTSSTRAYGGAGLGLAISKKLALMMGGDVEVLSKKGKGSVFTFTIAVKFPQNMMWIRKDDLSEIAPVKKKASVPKLKGTVLLAEDNVVNQTLIVRVLRKTGVDVVTAMDGVEACDLCDKRPPDFVLMDINMPNRDGLEATKILRDNGHKMPIYALTAETAKKEINKALDAGCDGFLSKPLNITLLHNALSEAMEHRLRASDEMAGKVNRSESSNSPQGKQ